MSSVRDSTALRNIAGIVARDSGGTARVIVSGLVRDSGNVLRTIFNSLSAGVSPDYVSGLVASGAAQTVTTNASTATPTGGIAPFTYAWTKLTGGAWTIISPTAAATSFTSPAVAAFGSEAATFRCTITDAAGATASADLTAEVHNIGGSGGGRN